MRQFHISDVLSVTTGRLVSHRGIDGIYDILNYMTDDDLFTHQLPRAFGPCAIHLIRQYPQLADLDVPQEIIDLEDISALRPALTSWIDGLVAQHGEYLDVAQLPIGVWQYVNPVQELVDRVGPEKVIVIRPIEVNPN